METVKKISPTIKLRFVVKELSDDPTILLSLFCFMSLGLALSGTVGFLMGLLAGFMKIIAWLGELPPPSVNVAEMLGAAAIHMLIGYGSAILFHTVGKLYKKAQ